MNKKENKKKVFYIRMESNEYVDFKVLASNKKDAEQIAQENSYKAQGFGDSFETGEISDVCLLAFDDFDAPTKEEPVVVMI